VLVLSWNTFRDRWQVFAGAIITVCLGVALVQSSLLTLVTAATAKVPPGLPEAEARALRDGYDGASTLLGLIVGLSTFVAIFIVSSTFAFTVAQRRRDLALMRLTGAGRGQIRLLLLGEALLLGGVGSVLGVLVGLPVMRLEAWMLREFGFVPPGFEGQWRPWVLAVSLGTGTGIAVLGVLGASRRASRVRPLEALRETGQAARVMTASRWVLGVLFLALGVAQMVLVVALGGEAALGLSLFVSIALVVGFSALSPLVVPLVSWLFGLLFRGHLGQLAHANLRSGVRRSASTAAPIMVLVAFVAGIAGIMGTLSEATRYETVQSLRGDFVVTADRPIGSELAAVDGVRTVSEEVTVPFEVQWADEDAVGYDPATGIAVEPAAYADTHRLDLGGGDLGDLRGATVAVSPTADSLRRWRVGEMLPVRIDGEVRELRIVALLPRTISGALYLLPAELAPAEPGERQYVIRLAGGADAPAVADRLAGLGETATVDEWIRRSAEQRDRESINVMVALLGMAMLYTVIGMVNAVVISASDRRSEFATARVTGLTRGQVVRMVLWESLAVVAIGLFLGGLAATATVLGAIMAIQDLMGVTIVSMQWPLLAGLGLGSALVVGLVGVITTLSATRTPPIRLVAARE
jgi:putative ABC transport system permease protein